MECHLAMNNDNNHLSTVTGSTTQKVNLLFKGHSCSNLWKLVRVVKKSIKPQSLCVGLVVSKQATKHVSKFGHWPISLHLLLSYFAADSSGALEALQKMKQTPFGLALIQEMRDCTLELHL